ncbi:MAG: ATP-dependent Clp protease proteolytic subunit [Clostridia bacterium]|nr:ATP-dependent Clp protease proteolytic subunit [Clostridia bacterium]
MEENNEQQERRENIIECGIVETSNSRGRIRSLNIIGTIEGHTLLPSGTKSTKYEHVLPHLVAVEEDDEVDGLLVLLNTVGGDVEAGLAIAEMIAGMKKPTVSLVLGGSHSIGVPLAVATDKSFIVPSATMTIHPMRINGIVIGVMQTFRYLNKMQDRIIDFIVRNSKIDHASFKNLMLATDEIANDVGTVLFGEQAVECGLIDAVGGVEDALSALYSMIDKK